MKPTAWLQILQAIRLPIPFDGRYGTGESAAAQTVSLPTISQPLSHGSGGVLKKYVQNPHTYLVTDVNSSQQFQSLSASVALRTVPPVNWSGDSGPIINDSDLSTRILNCSSMNRQVYSNPWL